MTDEYYYEEGKYSTSLAWLREAVAHAKQVEAVLL